MAHRLPTGTVTFLFTDLVVSTRLWDTEPDAMRTALAKHDEILRAAVTVRGGHVVKGTGDGIHAVFATADDALGAAIHAQLAFAGMSWTVSEPLLVRMGLHTGRSEERDGDYFGTAVNRASRLMSVGHGGQVLLSGVTADLLRDGLRDGVGLRDLGEHRLRDLGRSEHVFQIEHPELRRDFPRLRTMDAFPGNLPMPVDSFVGRDEVLARVVGALGESRVVTLTGVGGVGKTRLATHAAADVLPDFRDGAWLCGLQAVRDSESVAAAIASVLQVTTRTGMTLDESIVVFLREQ